jgi:hypothetical protein
MQHRVIRGILQIAIILILSVSIGCASENQQSPSDDGGPDTDTDTDTDTTTDSDDPWSDPFDEDECPDMSGVSDCIAFVNGEVASSGDGQSWAEAFATVQEGIDFARCGAFQTDLCVTWQVWVAQGTYYTYRNHVANTVWLRSNVAVYGGFAGNETALADRNWETNQTVLDGREDGGDNHVANVSIAQGCEQARLDGFTITGGAVPASMETGGAGLYVDGCEITVENCLFTDNEATFGGGLYGWNCSVDIRNSSFEHNTGTIGSGGADFTYCVTTIDDCTFSNNAQLNTNEGFAGGLGVVESSLYASDSSFSYNAANRPGGGIVLWSSYAEIDNCTIQGNVANQGGGINCEDSLLHLTNSQVLDNSLHEDSLYPGGGLVAYWGGEAIIEGCLFEGNTNNAIGVGGGACFMDADGTIIDTQFVDNHSSDTGGGVVVQIGSVSMDDCTFESNSSGIGAGAMVYLGDTVSVTNTEFTSNTAVSSGGGLFVQEAASVDIDGCSFIENHADTAGALAILLNEESHITNSLFAGNTAETATGAIGTLQNTSTAVLGCTFYGNSAPLGAACSSFEDEPRIGSSIFWANEPDPFYFSVLSDPIEVTYSNVEGGYPGEGNIDANPLFVDAEAGDFHLQESSPCIDSGDPDAGLETDLEGNPRDDQPDMGAYEYQGG